MNIDGWKKIVLRRLASLLVISILIFLLVFGLLYYAIKSFITQKKIADIKTDFVNNITHELKTPLSTLTLATKMLKVDANITGSENAKSFVNTIERQNKRLQYLNTIIDDFKLSLHSRNIIINKSITIQKEIYIDKFYFTTAILNILENAVKYGKDNLNISISATSNQNFEVSIADNGIGIPKKELPFLFDKFYRVGNKEIHNVKGLGLGLYYTNQIVKAHEGKITVESEVNTGTTFTIKIPLK